MDNRESIKKKIYCFITFVIIGCFLLTNVQKILVNPEPNNGQRLYRWIHGFFDEPKDSLDAVLIGSSNTYTFWLGPLAFQKYGICVYPFTTPSQPLSAAKSMIEEARKVQKDALYIIAINSIYDNSNVESLHYFLDYIPSFSQKVRMLKNLSDKVFHLSWKDKMELLFPIVRFHSRWDSLLFEDFHPPVGDFKGACFNQEYFDMELAKDVSGGYYVTQERDKLPEFTSEGLELLLDYCDKEKVNVLFFISPQSRTDSLPPMFNTAADMIRDRGYTVLDLSALRYEIDLDPKADYVDDKHTNFHGALKVTDYFADYLVENYTFMEKTGGYESWDLAYNQYLEIFAPYLTKEELSKLP